MRIFLLIIILSLKFFSDAKEIDCMKELGQNYIQFEKHYMNALYTKDFKDYADLGLYINKIEEFLSNKCVDKRKLIKKYPLFNMNFDLLTGKINPSFYNRFSQDVYININRQFAHGAFESGLKLLDEIKTVFDKLNHPIPANLTDRKYFSSPEKTCSFIDLSDRLPPIRDQNLAGWCVAYSYADLFSFELSLPISGRHLGHILGPSGQSGRGPDFVKYMASTNGLCKETTLSSDLPPLNFIEQIALIEKEALHLSQEQCSCDGSQSECDCSKILSLSKALFGSELESKVESYIQVFPFRFYNDFHATKETPLQTKLDDNRFTSQIANYLCRSDRKDLTFRKMRIKLQTSTVIGTDFIDQGLNNKKPVRIGYPVEAMNPKTKDRGGHSAVVVGRRFKNNQCQYLIRNSWGSGQCLKLINEEDACLPAGHFWAPFTHLDPIILDAGYLEDLRR